MVNALNDAIKAGKEAVHRHRSAHSPLLPTVNTNSNNRPPETLVPSLRAACRSSGLTAKDVELDLFITAGLRATGVEAYLIVGREMAPPSRSANYLSWVETATGGVISTGAPVHELYEEILRVPADAGTYRDEAKAKLGADGM